ncbi:MAG TPA: hypothetical protein VFI95_15290 [Terriglobales bacterium]|nr:hypothetical protein [Terriglobales bacterium]
MNKKTTLLASLGLFVGLAVPPAYGQVWGVRVRVPFKFVVANKTLPEGDYVLSSIHDEVFVQDSKGKRVAMVMTNAIGGRRTVGKTGEVIFECYNDLCFLSQVWTPGRNTGRELLKSRVETEIAKRENGKYFALLGTEPRK